MLFHTLAQYIRAVLNVCQIRNYQLAFRQNITFLLEFSVYAEAVMKFPYIKAVSALVIHLKN